MSERTARLDELLREEISAIISREIADPRIGFVTVTSVDVAPDLAHATAGEVRACREDCQTLSRLADDLAGQMGKFRL